MLRLFVAIELSPDIKKRISSLTIGLPAARWVRQAGYHLSLRFIGEVDEVTAYDIDAALCQVLMPRFEIELSGVGYFGKKHNATQVWIGVIQNKSLIRLQQKIENTLQRIGLPSESRKYTPHVTLARLKRISVDRLMSYIIEHSEFTEGPITVNEFALYSSYLSSSGAIYTKEIAYSMT